jgi:hypothetical protein
MRYLSASMSTRPSRLATSAIYDYSVGQDLRSCLPISHATLRALPRTFLGSRVDEKRKVETVPLYGFGV